MSADVEPQRAAPVPSRAARADGSSGAQRASREPEDPELGSPEQPGSADAGPRRRRRTVRRAVLVVVALLVLAALWLAFRGWQAATALERARDLVPAVQQAVSDRDSRAIEAQLPPLDAALARADSATGDPVWVAAGWLPWVGDDLRAVRTVAHSLHGVTSATGPAIHDLGPAFADPQSLVSGGRVDLAPLQAAAPALARAAAAADRGQAAVAAIDPHGLASPLVAPVAQARDALGQLRGVLDGVSQAATLLPPMLGADGTRTYLVALLNTAELRSAGGIVGSVMVVRADDGAVQLVSQSGAPDALDAPVLPLTPDELAVDGDRLGRWVQDAVLTPDFPRSAQLLAARWKHDSGLDVDGVVALDPVAASYVVGATGPVTGPDGATIDADNFLQSVLRDAYADISDADVGARDRYFGTVAGAVFTRLTTGQGDGSALVDAVRRAAGEGRIRVWSAHPSEQHRLAPTDLGAAFLSSVDHAHDAGVFLDDATTAKLDYYLTTSYTVASLRCTGEHPSATVRVELAYDPPADIVTAPPWVVGYGDGLAPGTLATRLTVFAPVGAPLETLRTGTGLVSGDPLTSAGRAVQSIRTVLAPGQRAAYEFDVPLDDGRLVLWTTPTLTSPGMVRAACG